MSISVLYPMVVFMVKATKIVKVISALMLAAGLSGCAGTIVAGLTLSELLTAGSIGSTLITGKGLGEHAMDMATGKDCRIIEGAFRADRDICEEKNSVATEDDFKGLVALVEERKPSFERENADFAIAVLDQAKTKPGYNSTNKNLLMALKAAPAHPGVRDTENILPARITVARSIDNYTNGMIASIQASPVSMVDLKDRLVSRTDSH